MTDNCLILCKMDSPNQYDRENMKKLLFLCPIFLLLAVSMHAMEIGVSAMDLTDDADLSEEKTLSEANALKEKALKPGAVDIPFLQYSDEKDMPKPMPQIDQKMALENGPQQSMPNKNWLRASLNCSLPLGDPHITSVVPLNRAIELAFLLKNNFPGFRFDLFALDQKSVVMFSNPLTHSRENPLIGALFYSKDGERQITINYIVIDSKHVHQGLGTQLIKHLKSECQKEDVNKICACATFNSDDFFIKNGFKLNQNTKMYEFTF